MNRIETTVRWMVRGDLIDVQAIDAGSFDDPLDGTALHRLTTRRRHVALVADLGELPPSPHPWSRLQPAWAGPVGYVVFEMWTSRIVVRRLAVSPDHRRLGVGESLLRAVMAKVGPRRPAATFPVSDRNLSAQLWLRALGWRAVEVVEDEYRFQWPVVEG